MGFEFLTYNLRGLINFQRFGSLRSRRTLYRIFFFFSISEYFKCHKISRSFRPRLEFKVYDKKWVLFSPPVAKSFDRHCRAANRSGSPSLGRVHTVVYTERYVFSRLSLHCYVLAVARLVFAYLLDRKYIFTKNNSWRKASSSGLQTFCFNRGVF